MTLNAGEHVDELILAELDDAVGAVERRTIESHVATCPRCASLRMEQRSLQHMLAGPQLSSMDLGRGHDLVWTRLAEPRPARAGGFWRTAWGAVALIATIAVVAGVTLTFVVTQGAARPDTRAVVIAQQDVSVASGVGTVTITERLGTDGSRQVVVATDLRLVPSPTTGVLEIRAQQTGESYGVLATVPSLTGVSRVRIEGILPPLPANANDHYDVWIHLEVDGRMYDSPPIPLRLTSDRTGMHARSD